MAGKPSDPNKPKRPVGPKRVLVLIDKSKLPEGVTNEAVKQAIVGVATNPNDALDACDKNASLTFVRLTVPKQERAAKSK